MKSLPRLRRFYVVALYATAFDIMSTTTGISLLGWEGFGEGNIFIRTMWPWLGMLAPLAYWPIEAAGIFVVGYLFFYVPAFLKHPERATWFFFIACQSPLFAAAYNTLFLLHLV